MQKFFVALILLLLNSVNYIELRHLRVQSPLKHNNKKNDRLRSSLHRQHVSKRYKASRKSMRHDNDEERNITMLFDRVGSYPFQQHQQYDQQQQPQQQHLKSPSQKHYHQGRQSKYVKKRPVINKTGTKRDFHSMIANNDDSPSMTGLFTSNRPLGTPVGFVSNSPIGNFPNENLESPGQEVPIGPLSSFMSGKGMLLPQPIQADYVGGSMPDASTFITPQQTTFSSESKHLFQQGMQQSQGGITDGGYIQKGPLHMRGPSTNDRLENVMNTIIPHQTTFSSETKHLYQNGVFKNQAGIADGGYLQKYPLQMMGPGGGIRTEDTMNTIVPHQTTFFDSPKHLYQPGIEKTQDGFVSGGFLQKHPITMESNGAHHIIHKPIHISDPHATTSYETLVEQGAVHDHPCLNGGIYFALAGHYQCICREEFIGKNCQDKNYCQPCPCKNSGTCHNIRDEPFYKCHCKIGFYGYECDKRDPCFPNPCKNRGVCTHDGETLSCICNRKFRGKRCDTLNNCNPDPCQNGGTCIELKGEGKFQCDCLPMYRGTLCRSRSYCFVNPCRNGGICREGEDRFVCDCPKGLSGPVCSDRICQPDPCMNGGTCIEDGDKFRCVCLPWTAGNLCEETRPCLTKPCMHGGRCIDSYSGFHWSFGPLQYYCLCKTPYKGMNCESHGCQNCHKNAHCEVDHCVCDEGFEGNGQSCRKADNPCFPNPCMNKGVCMEVADFCSGQICGFKCACSDPYVPPLCKNKNPCDPDPCVNGVCLPMADGTSSCQCDPGFRGPSCADKDACHPNPCQHHGQCKDSNGTATCSCPGQWKPPYCKECGCPYRSVEGSPMQFCSPEGACICPVGYTANTRAGTCEKQQVASAARSPCQSVPCESGGTCMDISETEFSCLCARGYSGKVCQHKSACNPGPCQNGGTCREQEGKFLGCDCPPHFSPPLCKKPEALNGPCQPNPCLQGGVCISNGGAYDCICAVRFTGPHCNVDRCSHCDPNAKCVNGKCKCITGYIGNGYVCEREMCEATCVEWSTCIDGQCVCNPGYANVYNKCIPRPIMPGEEEDEEDFKVTHPVRPDPVRPTSGINEGSGPGINPPATVRPRTWPTVRPDIVLPKKGEKVVPVVPVTERPVVATTPVHEKQPVVEVSTTAGPGLDVDKLGPPGSVGGGDISKGPPGSKRTLLLDDQDEEDNAFAEPSIVDKSGLRDYDQEDDDDERSD